MLPLILLSLLVCQAQLYMKPASTKYAPGSSAEFIVWASKDLSGQMHLMSNRGREAAAWKQVGAIASSIVGTSKQSVYTSQPLRVGTAYCIMLEGEDNRDYYSSAFLLGENGFVAADHLNAAPVQGHGECKPPAAPKPESKNYWSRHKGGVIVSACLGTLALGLLGLAVLRGM